IVDISPTEPGSAPVATACRPYRASSSHADALGDSARTSASLAATTSANDTDNGSEASSSAKSDRWSRAQISKKPAALVTRCSPRILPRSRGTAAVDMWFLLVLSGQLDTLSASRIPATKVSPSPTVPAGLGRCGAGTQVACHP